MVRNLKIIYLIPGLIALAMNIYGLVASFVNTSDNRRDSGKVAHSRRVLVALQETIGYMLETALRGLVISGDEADLEPSESALQKLDSSVAALAVLTRDNSSQQLKMDPARPWQMCNNAVAMTSRTASGTSSTICTTTKSRGSTGACKNSRKT